MLYHENGLATCYQTKRQAEIIKKKICKIFSERGLKITVEANKKDINFLEINLNLETGLYRPYMKPNSNPTYVHKDSKHLTKKFLNQQFHLFKMP